MPSPVRVVPVRVRLSAPLVLAAVLVGGLFAVSAPGSALTADEATLASAVNGARQAAGLPALTVSAALSDVARAHSAAMAASGTLSHSGDLAGAVGGAVADWTSLAENVAVAGSVTEAHRLIMGSAVHRANVLGDFTLLGVGVATASDGRVWVTETFAKAATTPAPAPAPAPEPVATETTVVETVDPTATTAAVAAATVAPAPAPAPGRSKAAKAVKPARRTAAARVDRAGRPAPASAATAAPAQESCLPEQAQPQGQGHAYGRCGAVPQGKGGR